MATIETECGKKIKQKIEFKNTGEDFSGLESAEKYLKENGFSKGSMQRNSPIGVVKEQDVYISKWRDLGTGAKLLDGALCSFDFREKDVTLFLFID